MIQHGWRTCVCALVLAALATGGAQAASFVVTKTADTNDGACDADCSLREAIGAANSNSGPDDITAPAGMYVINTSLTISSDVDLAGAGADLTIIDGNAATRVIDIIAGTVQISGVTIQNAQLPAFTLGAGIQNLGTLTIRDSAVRDNFIPGLSAGGGIYTNGDLSVINTTISNNTSDFGAGITIDSGNVMIVNSTISGNSEGAGIYNLGTLSMNGSTITGNALRGLTNPAVRSTATVGNSIIAGNAPSDCTMGNGTFISAGNNLDSDGTCSGFTTVADAGLAPLAQYGGATETHALCTGPGAPHPACALVSPALDAGNPAPPGSGGGACEATDQRGFPRGATPCDIGAHEVGCGDTVVDEGETCDDGNFIDDDGCDSNCTLTGCGNGIMTSGEECEDGNLVDTDGCTRFCTICGNTVVSAPEQCDDGALVDGDGCDSNCTLTACGNGVPAAGEDCDDGNLSAGDCCSPVCAFDPAGTPCIDDGNPCTADTCDPAGACLHPAGNSGAECRAPAAPCDAVEVCDGLSASCPADEVEPATTVCRPVAGICDVPDACDGLNPSCPADEKRFLTLCRVAVDVCDAHELCDGVNSDCPADGFVPNGTSCNDGRFCNGTETCQDGACADDSPDPCVQVAQCDEAEDVCLALCTVTPATGCRGAQKSALIARDRETDTKDRLVWRWLKGEATTQAEFGQPLTSTEYALCVYEGPASSLVAQAHVPADGTSWGTFGLNGYRYRDQNAAEDGIEQMLLRGSDENTARAVVHGKGLELPDLALPLDEPVTTQLVNGETGVCWEARFTGTDIRKNDDGRFTGRSTQ